MRELVICSILLMVIFGGLGWIKYMYWEWLRDRDSR